MRQYYILTKRGAKEGPISEDELRNAYCNGTYAASTYVWSPGMTEWLTLYQVFPNVVVCPPPPKVQVPPPPDPTAPPPLPSSVQKKVESYQADEDRQSGFNVGCVILVIVCIVMACFGLQPKDSNAARVIFLCCIFVGTIIAAIFKKLSK